MMRVAKIAAIAVFVIMLCGISALSQKTDKVYLKNGDIFTGEIKSLSLAMLNFKMDGTGTISIKWEHIIGIQSTKIFQISLKTGRILVDKPDSAFFAHSGVTLNDIVAMSQIKDKFIKRISGNADLGFSYSKSSRIAQLNFGGAFVYVMPSFETSLKVNSYITADKDSLLTRKQDVTLNFLKHLKDKYFLSGDLGWQQNTELGIAKRFLVNAAGGKALVLDNHNRLLAAGGFSLSRETPIAGNVSDNNIDGLIFIEYKRFYYSSPKVSIDADYSFYPGLNNWGRIRMQADANVKIEIFKDFTVGTIFYYNYDNRPPAGAVSRSDYGISFSIGYVFGK